MQKMQHDLGALVLRLAGGGIMLYGHGLDKLLNFGVKADYFPDPLHVGATASLALAVFAEAFCALAVAAGFLTRWSVLPLMVTMGVAAFIVHAGDPFAKKEMALLYLAIYVGVWAMGSGSYSLDHLLKKLKSGKKGGGDSMGKIAVVMYQVKKGATDENRSFVDKVFEKLKSASPPGVQYASVLAEDGVTFIHTAHFESEEAQKFLTESDEFKAFQRDLKDRCEVPPKARFCEVVGSYGLF